MVTSWVMTIPIKISSQEVAKIVPQISGFTEKLLFEHMKEVLQHYDVTVTPKSLPWNLKSLDYIFN